MKLVELQEILGGRIKTALDPDLSPEDRRKEIETSQTICALAKQMINNADIVLRANKMISEGKLKESAIEKMIE